MPHYRSQMKRGRDVRYAEEVGHAADPKGVVQGDTVGIFYNSNPKSQSFRRHRTNLSWSYTV